MKLLDIHTHSASTPSEEAILNVSPAHFAPQPGRYYSVGYHPWHLSDDGSEDWNRLNEVAHHPQVLAIGEAGLDKVAGADFAIQLNAFEQQATLAEEVSKPLIIHCVRSFNEVMTMKKTLKSTIPWIIHGFRGKRELAEQLCAQGFFITYGFRYNEEALRATPPNRLFLESDESTTPIHRLYEEVAGKLLLTPEELVRQVRENIRKVFFK